MNNVCFLKKFIDFFGEREKGGWDQFAVPLVYAFIGWLLSVPWPEMEPTIFVHPDDAPTTWATPARADLCFWY